MLKRTRLAPYNKLSSISYNHIKITDLFWSKRQEINKDISLPLMLEKLEEDHHIDNFRVAAGLKKGIHLGDFYFDSDLYKWLEGALYFHQIFSLPTKISSQIKEIIGLIEKSQLKDGYLNTFYTLNFLQKRFTNFLIFHELYCAGHLIEAALAEANLTNNGILLKVAIRFTNLLVNKILNNDLRDTAGHPEIELALIRLYRKTKNKDYLNLCDHLIKERGNIPHLRTYVMRRLIDAVKTFGESRKIRQHYLDNNEIERIEKEEAAEFLEGLTPRDWLIFLRQNLNGKQYQLNTPIREAYNPVGHAVRALYLYSGAADLYSETGDESLLDAMELLWLKMVKGKIYITGGTGSVKAIEGFGKDFQLSLENSYSETCAAIANIMWNWRLLLITKKCKYADLIERLLYNAMLPGQSLDGRKYFYVNPMISNGEHTRKEWFKCPCCPTNYIRFIPQIGKYIYSISENDIWIHQYIGNEAEIPSNSGQSTKIIQKSEFPWDGKVSLQIINDGVEKFSLYLRIPDWCENPTIYMNDEKITKNLIPGAYFRLENKWNNGDLVVLDLPMKPLLHSDKLNRKETKGKKYIQYGPLIYCVEEVDNQDLQFSRLKIAKESDLENVYKKSILGGMTILRGKTTSGRVFTAIPYFAWCNRKPTKMRVWINSED
ncbi:MAG: hypothetical protein BAJALOKI3v1_910005 [Promethearchaeota archaeon]|jgi:hypothetical protein|nr:MAG: hypothetical protein BAJALOKI3v1_910005 [Candidatus Lokiarchaeota archaeon]